MAHIRKQVRGAAVTLLTGLATTGSNVFPTRLYPIAEGKLPCLLVYTNSESAEVVTLTRPRLMQRDLELVVEGLTKDTTSIDDALDQIALEVEEAIGSDQTLGGLGKDIVLSSSEVEISAEGDQPVGSVRLTYLVRYMAKEDDLEVAL